MRVACILTDGFEDLEAIGVIALLSEQTLALMYLPLMMSQQLDDLTYPSQIFRS